MENKMKLLKCLLLFCFLLGTLPGVSLAGEIERIQAKGELVVSLNKGYPPFSMVIDNQLQGLDVDLAALVAESLGVKIRFVQPDTYDQQIPTLLSGKADIIIAAMTKTVDRGLKVNFTVPYFQVSQSALVLREKAKPGAESYFDLLEVEDLKLGVKADTTHERFARELFPTTAIQLYPTADAAAKALVAGQINAMAADSPFVTIWKEAHPEHYLKIKPLLSPVTREHYAFAIRKGDMDFLTWLNLFLNQIQTDGTLGLLAHEYFELMPWLDRNKDVETPTRAVFLKNKFIQQKKEQIEKRRQALKQRNKITYD